MYFSLINVKPLELDYFKEAQSFKLQVIFLGDFSVLSFCVFRGAPLAYGGFQATVRLLGAAAAGLYPSHSNVGSEPHL